jgi:outer membrane protein assembly factor BamA
MFIALVCINTIQAQKKLWLNVIVKDSGDKAFHLPDYQRKFDNPAQRIHEMQKVLFSLYDNAYLSASYDSTMEDTTLLNVYLFHGKRYEWAYLKKGNVDEEVLSQLGFRERVYRNKPFYYKDALMLMDKVVSFYEDHGYPFAQIHLDSVKLKDNTVAAVLSIQKRQLIKIDSIEIKGTLKLSSQYLYGYLGIKPGDVYNESKIRAISLRLKSLPFLMETKSAQVIFVQGKAKVFLFLSRKSANQFNGIVGILPGASGKVTITGDVNLQLQNSFHRAEEIGFHWQHLQPMTQNLLIHFSYPYLFNTPFGLDEDFKLYKQDTTYLQTDEKVGLKYLMTGGSYWKVYYENISSSLLSTSTLQYSTSGLPNYADNVVQLYGIEFKAANLDYIYNPRSGYELLVNVAAGTKTISKNAKLDPAIYDGLQLNSDEYRASLNGSYYVPLTVRSTIKLQVQGAYINAPSLLLNDLYRIGGFQVLRGFDEQSFYTSAYSVGTIEFHYLLEQNSFMFVFFDQGLCRETFPTVISYFTDTPFGFGAGMNFQTKAGIFSISYALGQSQNSAINFSQGKISFGLVNNF